MKNKQHETPEFQVIRQNEANAKFFVASFNSGTVKGPVGAPESVSGDVTNSYSKVDANGWF